MPRRHDAVINLSVIRRTQGPRLRTRHRAQPMIRTTRRRIPMLGESANGLRSGSRLQRLVARPRPRPCPHWPPRRQDDEERTPKPKLYSESICRLSQRLRGRRLLARPGASQTLLACAPTSPRPAGRTINAIERLYPRSLCTSKLVDRVRDDRDHAVAEPCQRAPRPSCLSSSIGYLKRAVRSRSSTGQFSQTARMMPGPHSYPPPASRSSHVAPHPATRSPATT